jgi:hypothetical protein
MSNPQPAIFFIQGIFLKLLLLLLLFVVCSSLSMCLLLGILGEKWGRDRRAAPDTFARGLGAVLAEY